MNVPSRNMRLASKPQQAKAVVWILLAGLVGCLVWGIVVNRPLRWVTGGTFLLMGALTVIHRIRLRRIREQRKDESICTFARSLPAKAHDTWVVRAVYEEVSRIATAPLRPSDNVEKFWGIADEDLDDVAFRVAERACRSMEGAEKNPLYGRVHTVADMIAFFELQPKLPRPIAEPPLSATS